MLGIGFWEMVIIAGIALIVIGPDKFPDFAKIILRTIRDIRGYVDEVKDEVARELKPVKKELHDFERQNKQAYLDVLAAAKPTPPMPVKPEIVEQAAQQAVAEQAAPTPEVPVSPAPPAAPIAPYHTQFARTKIEDSPGSTLDNESESPKP